MQLTKISVKTGEEKEKVNAETGENDQTVEKNLFQENQEENLLEAATEIINVCL